MTSPEPNDNASPTTSPFKLLDAYTEADKDKFFGRDDEIERLFNLLSQSDIVLVYGPSGTGKTSLIQSGLAKRFRKTDWQPLFVRRKGDLNASLKAAIAREARTPVADDASLAKAVRSLYLDNMRPVYLIFDQFEELFIFGDEQEQEKFFADIAALLSEDVACKVMISLREEYFAMLDAFEKVLPELFDRRLRIEPMTAEKLKTVIVDTVCDLGIQMDAAAAPLIIDKLGDRRKGVQLAYLQVYLDKLYQGGEKRPKSNGKLVFDDQLIKDTGKLGDVLAGFLDLRSADIQKRLAKGVDAHAVRDVLEAFATLEGTKSPLSREELDAKLENREPKLEPTVVTQILTELRQARILRDADGVDELAHDSLALRIADKRSLESKTLLQLKNMVSSGLAASKDDHRRVLSPQDLAKLKPYRKQLGLSTEEEIFVTRSRWRNRLSTVRQWVVPPLVIAAAAAAVFVGREIYLLDVWDEYPKIEALAAAGQYDQAMSKSNAVWDRIDWNSPDAYRLAVQQADILVRWGQRDGVKTYLDDAKTYYDRLSKLHQGDPDALNVLCWHRAIRNFEMAAAYADCQRALQRPDAVDSYALVLFRQGRFPEALEAYDYALELSDEDRESKAGSHYGRGLTLLKLGNITDGCAAFDAARGLNSAVDKEFEGYGLRAPGTEVCPPTSPSPPAPAPAASPSPAAASAAQAGG